MTRLPSRRIAIFIDSLCGGGAERVAANLANHWAGMGWEVTVVTFAPRSLDFYALHPAVKRIALLLSIDDGGRVSSVLWKNLRRIMAMRRVLLNIKPDIALGIMTIPNVLLALANFGLPIRAVGSEHVHPPQCPLGALRERLRRHSYARLDAVAVLTSESASWLKAHTNVRRVAVIPNAVPWPLPIQEPRISPKCVCPPGRKVLLGAGRLEPEKGFDSLLEAFAGIAQTHTDWDLVILGEGTLRTMIEQQVQVAGLEKRVHLPGLVGNVGEWYERADLYVMSSRFEGFGNTLAEALAYGLPAVSFDCDTGPRDIIRHEMDGLLVPPGDVTGLAAALDRLMRDANLRKRFAERAVEARERFSITRIAGMWEELFERVVE